MISAFSGFGSASLLLLAQPAATACGPDAPTGFYQGSVVSAQSGELEVTLNLRCAAGDFAGALVTPVGTFALRGGSYRPDSLTLRFDAGGDAGVISGAVGHDSLVGTFAVPGDSGRVALRRVAPPRLQDVPTPTLSLSPAQWREDIGIFAREIPTHHANAFAHYPRAAFNRDVAALERALDRLDSDQVYVWLDAIANRIGDGHTFVAMPGNDPFFPFVFKRFDGQYRVVAAAPEYARAVGARLLRVGDADVATARSRLLTLTPAAETMPLRDARVEDFLRMGLMLHGLGLVPDRATVRYTFGDDSGKTFAIQARSVPMPAADSIPWTYVFPSPPLTRQRPDDTFWFTYLPKSSLVYCNWRGYDSIAAHGTALLALIDSVKPAKILIDMRQNGGGDFTLGLQDIIEPLSRRPRLNTPDHLFVAIGVNTFSAGMSNSAQFRTRTRATLLGVPIGERPNSYQEAREMHLPNSWLMVRYSTKYYRFVDAGPNQVRPDREIPTSWSDYKAGRDPVFDYVARR